LNTLTIIAPLTHTSVLKGFIFPGHLASTSFSDL
jgi:hypothetical protein